MVELFRILFNDFSFLIYGVLVFLIINFYKPTTKKLNWFGIILTGFIVAVIYIVIVFIAAENIGEVAWVGITGVPASIISGLISATLTNFVLILIKKYKS